MANLFNMFQDIDDCESKDLKVRENYVRALFKYPGSKSRCVEEISLHLPYRTSYIEVFGGSAAILLSREKSKLEVYNDRFAGLVAFFRCMRDTVKAEALINRFEWCLHSREEFIFCKETWKDVTDDVERAARFLYIQHYSFAGIGKYFGRSTTSQNSMAAITDKLKAEWRPFHQRLKHVIVENQDWREMLQDFESPEAVFYLDPPYLNTAPQAYSSDSSMGPQDHVALLDRVFEMKAFVAVSSYDNELYEKYPWDDKIMLKVKTGCAMIPMGENANNPLQGKMQRTGTSVQEVLWIKK